MNRVIESASDAVPYQEFARLIGKTPAAVKGMIEKGKLPIVEMTDPQSTSGRAGGILGISASMEQRHEDGL